jgi:hypothetical protein
MATGPCDLQGNTPARRGALPGDVVADTLAPELWKIDPVADFQVFSRLSAKKSFSILKSIFII